MLQFACLWYYQHLQYGGMIVLNIKVYIKKNKEMGDFFKACSIIQSLLITFADT